MCIEIKTTKFKHEYGQCNKQKTLYALGRSIVFVHLASYLFFVFMISHFAVYEPCMQVWHISSMLKIYGFQVRFKHLSSIPYISCRRNIFFLFRQH